MVPLAQMNVPAAFWEKIPWPWLLLFMAFVVLCSSPLFVSWVRGRTRDKDAVRNQLAEREINLRSQANDLYKAAIRRAEAAEERCDEMEKEANYWRQDSYRGWGKARFWELVARNFRHMIINYRQIIDYVKAPHAPYEDIDIPPLDSAPPLDPEQYKAIALSRSISTVTHTTEDNRK
jgi:hypothetical protein